MTSITGFAVDVNEVIAEAAGHFERLVRPGVEVTHLLGATAARVGMSRVALEQVLSALILHAGDTMADGGRLTIATHDGAEIEQKEQPPAQSDYLVIDVTVSGIRTSLDNRSTISGGDAREDTRHELRAATALVQRAGGDRGAASVGTDTTIRVCTPGTSREYRPGLLTRPLSSRGRRLSGAQPLPRGHDRALELFPRFAAESGGLRVDSECRRSTCC